MNFTSRFIFIAILFVCTLKVTLADEWIATMICGASLELQVQHINDQGRQLLSWSPMSTYSGDKLCDESEVICIKDVEYDKYACQTASFDFKIQYGHVWSRYIHIDLFTVKSSKTILDGIPASFTPLFM
ncbi:hypothetical protein A0J61_00722 [Choanephora cucurbitarum]|uniref:Autophagy-related protein 27 n=1 Tax=Choanephora cucurbitarum TaxID=101091 RepID=A0A1C7NUP7_9FUNG|nr:hypothetical protein A0J61_00722 [Choanephora cucurbitarum]